MSKSVKTVTKSEENVVVKKGWRIKEYYVNLEQLKLSDTSKCPNQVQIILREMSERFNSTETAAQGKIVIESAIKNSSLKTVIDPAVLFAYYRKYMENYGLKLK